MVNCFSAGVSSYPADFLACSGGLGKRRDIPPGERAMREIPHPEERPSGRVSKDEGPSVASWVRDACFAGSSPEGRELLRRHLARCGRRVDEVGGELLVTCLGVLHCLLLHRAVATDAIGQR